ncbi:MAG: DUF4166 domain-containing protein [Mucilaginibacter sp.]
MLKCIGMLVGVYGIAYYFASKDPEKYWPLIFVGFAGKLLGPVGAFYYVYLGEITPSFLWVNVFNDLIWLFPFGWVLYHAWKGKLNVFAHNQYDKTLYQQFLGEEFEKLSPNLKSFHQSKIEIRVLGEFKIVRGKSAIANMFASIAGLPLDNDAAEAELVVEPTAHFEIWGRRLGDKKVISKQWLEGRYLVEKFQVVHIYLTGEVVNGDLIIADAYSTILGIPMPPFLTPAVLATGKDAGDGVEINVEIGFNPFGRIINYSGVVTEQKR